MSHPELSIVLPCYNESKNIPIILERLAKFKDQENFEVILVNNGSTDDSVAILMEMKKKYPGLLRLVEITKNIGYGHGIMFGLKAARGKVLAYSHADVQTPPEDILKGFKMVKEQNHDPNKILIKGLRVNRRRDENFLTQGLAKTVEMLLGHKLEDINGQPKIFGREFLAKFSSPPVDFSFDVYVMYLSRIHGLSLVTFPVEFGLRKYGTSKWASNLRGKCKTIFKYIVSIFRIALDNYQAPRNSLRQGLRFLGTGLVTNMVNYSVFFSLFRFFGLFYMLCSSAGFLAGLAVGFVLNRSWTFEASAGQVQMQLAKFFILNILSLAANLIFLFLLVRVLGIIPEIGQVAAIGLSTIINFFGSKFWAFRGSD